MTSNKLDPSLVAILVNREHSRLSNQIKALEKVLRAPYSDKEHQRLLTLAAQLKGSGSLNSAKMAASNSWSATHAHDQHVLGNSGGDVRFGYGQALSSTYPYPL
jgi:hypothetical protein